MAPKIPDEIKSLAEKLAMKSQVRHKMSAVIYNKKGVINTGYNRWLYKGTRKRAYGKYSIHAEIDCMLGVSKQEMIGASIYIYRQRGNLAKPCLHCMHQLIKNGVTNIYWSE